jgi:hypothetical protein
MRGRPCDHFVDYRSSNEHIVTRPIRFEWLIERLDFHSFNKRKTTYTFGSNVALWRSEYFWLRQS